MEKQKDKEEKKPAAVSAQAGQKELNIEELRKKIEDSEKKAVEYLAGWQRERADFLNYKKEVKDTIDAVVAFEDGAITLKILPILDNLEIAEKKFPENLKNDENVKGILQIKSQVTDLLKNMRVEEIKSIGEKFDPNFHEVVGEIEPAQISSCPQMLRTSVAGGAKIVAGKEIKSGIIVEEIQKGYKINGRLLRPAKVRVIK
jgi:molecular chaperone GrpE